MSAISAFNIPSPIKRIVLKVYIDLQFLLHPGGIDCYTHFLKQELGNLDPTLILFYIRIPLLWTPLGPDKLSVTGGCP